jgi:hypothetical protein
MKLKKKSIKKMIQKINSNQKNKDQSWYKKLNETKYWGTKLKNKQLIKKRLKRNQKSIKRIRTKVDIKN